MISPQGNPVTPAYSFSCTRTGDLSPNGSNTRDINVGYANGTKWRLVVASVQFKFQNLNAVNNPQYIGEINIMVGGVKVQYQPEELQLVQVATFSQNTYKRTKEVSFLVPPSVAYQITVTGSKAPANATLDMYCMCWNETDLG